MHFFLFYTWEHCFVVYVFSAFSTTGFERHTSLVFNPANPESSVEDCLAAVGDRVARELDTNLAAALNTLLPGSASLLCACEKYGALWSIHLCQFLPVMQKNLPHSSIFIKYVKRIHVHNTELQSRKVNVDIVPLASFCSLQTLKMAGVVSVWNFRKMMM